MRTPFDRIRQAVLFEFLALAFIISFGYFIFGYTPFEMGVIGLFGSIVATCWNYAYNLCFDLTLQRKNGTTQKSFPARIIHAIGFELTLLIIILPFLVFWLEISVWEAFLLDISMSVFFVFYTFGFTWVYDHIFPAPDTV